MGIRYSELPKTTAPTSDDYVAILDNSSSILKATSLQNAVNCTLGSADISEIGDGSVKGAIAYINEHGPESLTAEDISVDTLAAYVEGSDVQECLESIADNLTSNGVGFYLDKQNGMWGWNEDEERGADTFHPFSSIPYILNHTWENYGIEEEYTVRTSGYYLFDVTGGNDDGYIANFYAGTNVGTDKTTGGGKGGRAQFIVFLNAGDTLSIYAATSNSLTRDDGQTFVGTRTAESAYVKVNDIDLVTCTGGGCTNTGFTTQWVTDGTGGSSPDNPVEVKTNYQGHGNNGTVTINQDDFIIYNLVTGHNTDVASYIQGSLTNDPSEDAEE